MADQNQLMIEIGAKIDGLVGGVDQVKAKLESINSSADHISTTFSRLGEIILAAFSIEKITSFIESMAALGLSVERNMAILGASANEVVQLSGVAQLVGQDIDSLSIQLNRLTLNVQKSTRDGINPQAQALKLLGINAQQFIALPFEGKINSLQAAVSKFNPSLNLTNVLTEIGGRGFASQLPLLTKTKEQWDEMQEAVARARDGLAAAIPGMAQTHEKLTLMSESIQSLGARIFSVLKPAIDYAITAFTNFVQSIKGDDIRTYALSIGNSLISIATSVAEFFVMLGGTLDNFKTQWDSFFTVNVEISGVAAFVVERMKVLNAQLAGVRAMLGGGVSGIGDEFGGGGLAKAITGTGNAADNARQKIEAWADSMRKALGESLALNNAAAAEGASGGKANMGAINFGAAKGQSDELKAINDRYNEEASRIKELYGNFIFTEAAKTQDLIANLNQRYAAEIKAGESIKVANAKYALDLQKIHAQTTKDYEKDLNEIFSGLQGAINGQLRGMLAGTVSFAQGIKHIFGDMIIFIIQEIEKMAFKWAAHQLAMTLTAETGAAARTTAEATGMAASEGISLTKTVAKIMQNAGEVFSGVFAFLSPVMGPAAAGPATASATETIAGGLGIAGAAVGTDYVARTGLAVIHQGEAVVPAQFNTPYSGAGKGGTLALTINAVDARSFASLVNSNPSVFTTLIKRAMRDGALQMG